MKAEEAKIRLSKRRAQHRPARTGKAISSWTAAAADGCMRGCVHALEWQVHPRVVRRRSLLLQALLSLRFPERSRRTGMRSSSDVW